MAQKKITELQLRDDVTADLSFPSDDGIQSYRVTSAQILDYIKLNNSLTTKGDLITKSATLNHDRLAAGPDGFVLSPLASDAKGLIYKPLDECDLLANCTITASVASNEMTFAVKDRNGNDPSSTSPVYVSFKSPTTGLYEIVSLTSALSLVITNGSTCGTRSGVSSEYYPVLINDSGTIRLGVSRFKLPEDRTYTTVSEGGAGGADLSYALYSNAVYSSKLIRVIGRVKVTQATAGAHVTAPSEILSGKRSSLPLQRIVVLMGAGAGQTLNNSNNTKLTYNTTTEDDYSLMDGAAGNLTIPSFFNAPMYAAFSLFLSQTAAFNATSEAINMTMDGVSGNSEFIPESSNSAKRFNFSGVVANGTTTLSAYASQNSGANLTMIANAIYNWLRFYTHL